LATGLYWLKTNVTALCVGTHPIDGTYPEKKADIKQETSAHIVMYTYA